MSTFILSSIPDSVAEPVGKDDIYRYEMAEDPVSSNEGRSRDLPPRIRRRNRMITSCLECRRRKLKCDKLHPCTNCNKFCRECMFLAPALDSVSQKKLNELKDKMGSLEKVLENDIARNAHKRGSSDFDRTSPGDLPGEDSGSDHECTVPEDEKPLEPSPLAATDAAYEDAASEDLLDLGVRLGRMRLTERFGGTFRPRFAEELASSLGEPINTDMSDRTVGRLQEHDDFLAPGPTFIAPGSGFVFGDVGSRRDLIDFLPSKAAGDALLQIYYRRVHFIARVVHWPSFQLQYESFWTNILSGFEPQPSVQAIVFATWFSAIAAMEDEDTLSLFGSDKTTALSNLQTATEVALGKANFLRTSKIETLQALVIYLIPMVRDEVSRAHSVLVASAIRLGECMGLNRDPDVFGMSPIITHVRRILWFQLCWLDLRTSETHAPRPYLKRDDYDTKMPLDINDLDLMAPEPKERPGVWTDMTLSRLRFECAEMCRIVASHSERLRQKKISITYALGKIESFRRAMEAKYNPVIDASIPIQAYAKYFLTSAMSRMHVAILHRFHHSVHVKIPDRLREILIMSSIETMENFIALQQKPEFADWKWCSTSLTTWNPAMLMVMEMFIYPQRKEADRIWAIIDYTFCPDLHLTRDQKARQILRTIRDRIAFYRDMRQIREPLSLPSKALAVRMRETQHKPVSVDSILIKKEETENPLQENSTTQNQRQRSNTSPSGNHSSVGVSPAKNPELESWTFNTQSTLFVTAENISTQGTTPASRFSSSSPAPPLHASLPGQRSIAQAMSSLPGLDYGISPGSSPSNTADWPTGLPPDTTTTTTTTTNNNNNNNIWPSSSSSPPCRITSIPTSMHPNTTTFLPQPYPTTHLPFIATSQTGIGIGVEQMLQNPTTALVPDDSMALEIDWGEWDKIFPPDVNSGNLDHPRVVVR